MSFPKTGTERNEILSRMSALKENDVSWDDGKAFAHAFTADKEGKRLAEEAYTLFLWENGMDPTLFPSLLRWA